MYCMPFPTTLQLTCWLRVDRAGVTAVILYDQGSHAGHQGHWGMLIHNTTWLHRECTYCTHIDSIYVCMYVPYLQLTCWLRVAIVETAEGGEISHALNDWNTYCKDFNSLCSKVTVCLSKHSESENSLNGVEQLFLQILPTTLGYCCSRPPGESNTWPKCLIFTFLVNSKCKFSYTSC